ncbi:MAG: extracellular solute-binding protein [Lachnospiraceae bacterium]|nr:extracellular solute-binding protein [Lachnospiraceae bacterium]
MKRRTGAVLGLLMAISLLTGCHGRQFEDTFTMPAQFDESRQIELTFWAKNDTNKTQREIYDRAIEGFEALYPNVTVTMRLYNDYGKIYNDVITNISTGTTPNVCITYPDHIATYLTGSGTVMPLDELMEDADYGLGGAALRYDAPTTAQIIPEYLEEGKIGEHYYALPFMRSSEACYVNKTYVEALGYTLPETLTWDFVWEVSEKAMAKNPDGTFQINGQQVMIPFIYKSTDNMMIQSLAQLNAPYSEADGTVSLFQEETTGVLTSVAEHAKSGAFSTFKISGYPANFLNAGQCIFAVDSTAGSTWMGSDAPLVDIAEEKIVDFETAVMTVPQYDPADPKMISQGPSVCIFRKSDPQEVLASWLFVQYLLTDEIQIAYSETEGYVPVTSKARETDEYQEYLSLAGSDGDAHYRVKIDAVKLLMEHTADTFVTPVFNGSASLRDAAGQLIENVTKAVRRNKTVDEAFIRDLYEEVQALYHLDQSGLGASGQEQELGELPNESVGLIVLLLGAWCVIAAVAIRDWLKKRKE